MRIRSVLFTTAGVVGAAIGGAAIAMAIDDPERSIAPVVLSDASAPAETGTAGAVTPETASSDGSRPAFGTSSEAPSSDPVQEVDGLDQLVGVLQPGDDPDDWSVAGVDVDFGPEGWISAASTFEDFDGDGAAEPLLEELAGLQGREVTLGVRYELDEDDRDDADVFTVDGLVYRDPNGGVAPWQEATAGESATVEEISAAAARAVGDGATTIEVEPENDDGWTGWDVEVRATDGREFQVFLDLAGTVLDVRQDD